MDFPIRIVFIIVALVIGIASPYIFKRNDSPIEEMAEHVIKEETGIDIDFSPDDKEMTYVPITDEALKHIGNDHNKLAFNHQ